MGNGGRIIACAFGSEEPSELKALRAILRYCLHLTKKATAKSNKKKIGVNRRAHTGMEREEDTLTSLYEGDSLISGVKSGAHSLISGVSKTVYGRQTMDKKALRRMKQEEKRA